MLYPNTLISKRATALLFLASALLSHGLCLAAPPRVGDPFPPLANFGLAGPLPDLKGKVALVDFWASWCAPCKRSFPVMKELQDKYAQRGFVVVAISVDDNKAAMEQFLKKNPASFVVLHDPKGRLAERLALQTMPTSFVVGTDGTISAVHSGFDGEATRKSYVAEIERALDSSAKKR